MKKVLILIHNMKIGGGQKSLVSFLECLKDSSAVNDYEIHLMIPHKIGPLLDKVPENVKLIPAPREYQWLSTPFSLHLLTHSFSWRGLAATVIWRVRKTFRLHPKEWNTSQLMWQCWKKFVRPCKTDYDAAISYIDGSTNYFVIDKVTADKKTLWVHNVYKSQGYAPEFDRVYYEKADAIVTISEGCRQSIVDAHPQCENKTHILENITSSSTVLEKSREGEAPEFSEQKGLKLLSVGRLHHQKNYALAIAAAKILKEKQMPFQWLVVGEGGERENLQGLIEENGLNDVFRLVGLRENPYVYMNACDIFVQSSRHEGKSIVLDEAKILCKPIVTTNYETAKDTIEHGVNGWVTEMTPEALAEGIVRVSQDRQLREAIVGYLQKQPKGNEEQLDRYMTVMF